MGEPGPVVFVSPSCIAGGAERVLVSTAAAMDRRLDCPVHVVVFGAGPLEGWLSRERLSFSTLPQGHLRDPSWLFRATRQVQDLLQELGARLVVANMARGHLLAGPAAARLGIPRVWWSHNPPRRGVLHLDWAANLVPGTVCVAPSEAVRRGHELLRPPRPVGVVSNGVDVDAIIAAAGDRDQVRAELGWTGRQVVGIVARLQPWKGQHLLLDAAIRLVSSHDDALFVIVGGALSGEQDPYALELHALANALGDHAQMVDHQADVYPYLHALDVLVNASDSEPFGMTLLEGMALRRRLISADSGGAVDVVGGGHHASLFTTGSADSLASVLDRVLREEPEDTALDRAYAHVVQNYSATQTAAGLLQAGLADRP